MAVTCCRDEMRRLADCLLQLLRSLAQNGGIAQRSALIFIALNQRHEGADVRQVHMRLPGMTAKACFHAMMQ